MTRTTLEVFSKALLVQHDTYSVVVMVSLTHDQLAASIVLAGTVSVAIMCLVLKDKSCERLCSMVVAATFNMTQVKAFNSQCYETVFPPSGSQSGK